MASTRKVKASKATMVAKKQPSKPAKKYNYNGKDGHIGFFVTDSNNETAELPITPPEITITSETSDAVDNIINLGEVNRVGNMKLRKIEVESFLPWYAENSRFVNARELYGRARDYVRYFKAIQSAKKPIRVVISQTTISLKCTLQTFEYGFKEGLADEYYYKLVFVETKASKVTKAAKANKLVRKAKNGKKNTVKGTIKQGKAQPASTFKFNRGSKVYVRGPVWPRPDKKDGMNGSYNNYKGVIGTVRPGAKMPYQIKSPYGGSAGWTTKKNLYPRS